MDVENGLLDCNHVLGSGTQVVKELRYTLLSIAIIAEGVDDPNLSQGNGWCQSCGFVVARYELDVLDTASLGQC
jgi:hypothetical protein